LAALGFFLTWEATPPGPLVVAILAALVAYWIPELAILMMRHRRRKAFSNQLVDGLVLMSNGLRSGFVLPQAIQMLVEEMPAPISQEFRLVQEELRLGVDLDQALENCVTRTQDQDLALVVTAIKITRQLGGNLPEVFDRIVATVRDRKVLQGKAEALTAEGRLQALVVGLLPAVFAFLLIKLNPEMMELMWKTFPGFLALLLAIVLDVVGYLWVRKLSQIKY
jgi:tight adherence protein B